MYKHGYDRETAETIAGMLKENTGAHFLDSGGAYGRHHQRNQGRDFESEPECTLTCRWGYLEVTHNLYHWLNERLTLSEHDEVFQRFIDGTGQEDTHYLRAGEEWAKLITETRERCDERGRDYPAWAEDEPTGIYGEGEPFTHNTYNGEDLLSQVIQFFYAGGWIALSVHGGCDPRGGYTRPHLFTIDDPEGVAIFDNARATIGCSNCDASWYTDNDRHWHANNGEGVELQELEIRETRSRLEADDKRERLAEAATEAGVLLCDHETYLPRCPLCGHDLCAGFF